MASPTTNDSGLTLVGVAQGIRPLWRPMALADVICKAVAFVVLTPLVGLLLRIFIAASGQSSLADEEILFFFLKPVGWIALVVVGGVGAGVFLIEHALLMVIACGPLTEGRIGVRSALRFVGARSVRVVHLTCRMVATVALLSAPFLAVCGAVYSWLLTAYDINYYTAETPPQFWTAVSIMAVVLVALGIVLARVLLGWSLAMQIVLFEGATPREAIRASRTRTAGRRRLLAQWLLGWFAATMALSAVANSLVGALGRHVLVELADSLELVVIASGAMLVLWGVVNFCVTLVGAAGLSVLLLHVYCQMSGRAALHALHVPGHGSPSPCATYRPTRRALAWTVAAVATISAITGYVAFASFAGVDRAVIIAHRGGAAAAPENTLAAVRRGLADGAEWVEVDAQQTADGEIVIIHDGDLKKIAGLDAKINEARWAELADVDVGSWFGPEFAGERIPTLGQVLDMCRGRARVVIELKTRGPDPGFEERVIEIVEAHGMADQVELMSLDRAVAARAKSLRPDWRVGLLTITALGDLAGAEVDFLAVRPRLATRGLVESAHRQGKDVYVWTVNDPVTMAVMMGRGVDGIVTDVPARALLLLEERAHMAAVTRVLLSLAAWAGVGVEETSDDS